MEFWSFIGIKKGILGQPQKNFHWKKCLRVFIWQMKPFKKTWRTMENMKRPTNFHIVKSISICRTIRHLIFIRKSYLKWKEFPEISAMLLETISLLEMEMESVLNFLDWIFWSITKENLGLSRSTPILLWMSVAAFWAGFFQSFWITHVDWRVMSYFLPKKLRIMLNISCRTINLPWFTQGQENLSHLNPDHDIYLHFP